MEDMEYMQYSWTTQSPLTQYHIYKRLISKLKGYGVRGQLLQWTEDFLANRKMRVLLRYDTIEEFNVDSKAEY